MPAYTNVFTAAQSQRVFELPNQYIPGSVAVSRNGISLTQNIDYVANNGLTVILNDDADLDDEILIISISPDAPTKEVNNKPRFFDKLGFNFDKAKFGDALTVGGTAETYFQNNPIKLKEWEKNLVRTNDSSGYYRNPLIQFINSIENSAAVIRNVSNQVLSANSPYFVFSLPGMFGIVTKTQKDGAAIPENKAKADQLKILSTSANTLIASINLFRSHTNRLSGLVKADSEEVDYEKAMSIGSQIANIANAIDGIKDYSPILGSFTSLFIGGDLDKHSSDIINFSNSNGYPIGPSAWSNTNYYTINTGANIGVLPFTPSDCTRLTQKFNEINSLITTRREHDRNYYAKCSAALSDYSQLSNFVSVPAPPAIILLRDYIGTNKLKSLL